MRRGFFGAAPQKGEAAAPHTAAAAASRSAAPAAAAAAAAAAASRGGPADADGAARLRGTAAGASRLGAPPAASLFPPQLRSFQYVPPADGVAENLLVLLHGRGDRAAPFAAFARKLALPQMAALALEGPLEVPYSDGGRAWFQAFEGDMRLIAPAPGETRRTRSLAAAADAVCAALHALVRDGGWRYDALQLFGFSDGGTVVVEVARRFAGEQRLGGAIAIAAGVLPEAADAPQPPPPRTPALLTRGDADDVLPAACAQRAAAMLGPECELHVVPGKGHGMVASAAETRVLMHFWGRTLRAAAPAAAQGETLVELS